MAKYLTEEEVFGAPTYISEDEVFGRGGADAADDSFFSMDRAKSVAKGMLSLVPGMGEDEPEEVATPAPRMTPQQMERIANEQAYDREILRTHNPKADSRAINALADEVYAKRRAPKQNDSVEARAATYLESGQISSGEDALANAEFDKRLQDTLNQRMAARPADPITGETIQQSYRPDQEAQRVEAQKAELDYAREITKSRADVQRDENWWRDASDFGLALQQGAVNSFAALSSLAGADNGAATRLRALSDWLGEFKTDKAKAEAFLSAKRIAEAEAKGDWKTEVGAYMDMIADAPDAMLAQAVGSFATLGLGKAAQMAKIALAARGAGMSAKAFVATEAGQKAAQAALQLGARTNVAVSAGQGVGAVKGSQYEQTYRSAKQAGMSDEEAKRLAVDAQSYGGKGTVDQVIGGVLGGVAAATGPIEKAILAGRASTAGLRMGAPAALGKGFAIEGGTEALQGGQEKLAGNTAAIEAGVMDESQRYRGVAGSAATEGLMGGLLGGGVNVATDSNFRLTGDTAAGYQARVLADALNASLVNDTQSVTEFANRNYTTSGAVRPEATSVSAAIAREREMLGLDRVAADQQRANGLQRTQEATTVDEAISGFVESVSAPVVPHTGPIENLLSQHPVELPKTDELEGFVNEALQQQEAADAELTATMNPTGTLLVSGDREVAAKTLQDAGITDFIPSVDGLLVSTVQAKDAEQAVARMGLPDLQATYATRDEAIEFAVENKVADRVDVVDTGLGFSLTPKQNDASPERIEANTAAVAELKPRVPGASALRLAGEWPSPVRNGANDGGAGAAGQGVSRTARGKEVSLQSVATVASQAFGINVVPVTGLGNYGVAFKGNAFVDVDEVQQSKRHAPTVLAIATMGHEAGHVLQKSQNPDDQKAYKTLKSVVLQYANDGVVASRTQSEQAAAIAAGDDPARFDQAYAEDEIVNDVNGAMWLDPKFWGRLYEVDNGSTFRRVLYKFMEAGTRFVKVAKGSRLDASSFVSNVDAVREAAAQAWATRARGQQPPNEIADLPEFSRGVIGEVAPNPDQVEVTAQWNEQELDEKTRATRDIGKKVAQRIMDDMGLRGWTTTFSTGTFEGKTNPNFIVEAPDDATDEQLQEFARAAGFVLDQKAMVVFDENNTEGENLAGFVKVQLPKGLQESKIVELRQVINKLAPAAGDDTFRDGALVFGNFRDPESGQPFSELADDEFKRQIEEAVGQFEYEDGVFNVDGPYYFKSDLIWPDNREDYLKGTRYGKSNQQGSATGREGVWGAQGSGDALRAFAGQILGRRQQWIDESASGRSRRNRARELSANVASGTAEREYGTPREAAVPAVGVHFSKQRRSNLSSGFFGSGLKGAELDRLSGPQNSDLRKRLYFYVDAGNGVRPEAGVGGVKHVVKLNNLYDANKDPLGIVKSAKNPDAGERSNQWERGIIKAGFDGYLADTGGSQKFAVLLGKHDIELPSMSRNFDDFDELGAFNLDANDFKDGVEVNEDIDFDALQAELDAEMNQSRARPPARQSIEEPTDQALKEAGLHVEKAIAFGEFTVTPSNIALSPPKFLRVERYVNYEIRNFSGKFSPSTDLDSIATFVSGGKRFNSADEAVKFTQNQLSAEYLHKRGFDLASVYRKDTILKIAESWRAIAKKAGAFKYPGAETKSTSFPEIALAMGLFKDYKVTVEYDEEVQFAHRTNGRSFQAIIMERAKEMGCCTMGLANSDLGVPFYTVAGKLAENLGKKFVADTSLSVINTYRRTEQALSYALKSGNTGVMLPGPQNRVYGYNETPKTDQDHSENIARLALANMRNVEEMIPNVRRWSYEPATGKFVDSRGNSVEDAVAAALAEPDVRVMGIGRTTIARAVLTSQIIKGDFKAGDIQEFDSPVLYSRITKEDDPQPLSESWGQLNADGTIELTPQFAKWFKNSKVVDAEGKPLMVYHGTNSDITTFAPEKSADGVFHFSIDTAMANRFAVSRASDGVRGANVMPVYLAIKNPKRVTFINTMEIEAAKAEGYDGLIAENRGHLVAFEPAQIKSVFNNGDFDPENPDIRYSRHAIEDYMVSRNREMRQVSGMGQQVADIAKAMRAITELANEMRPVHVELSKRLSGEDLQKAVMAKFRNYVLPIGRTPHVLTMLGEPNQMMKIDPSIVYKVFVDKHANDLEGAQPKDIIEGLYKPAMVLKSGEKEFELVLPIVTSTGPLIAPVMTEAVMPTNGKKVSAIMSIYPRKVALGGDSILQRIKSGKLMYADAALAQVALTGNATPQVGIDAREVSLSSGTPPTRTSTASLPNDPKAVKPLNANYVGWDKASDDVLNGIASGSVKNDVKLMAWIGDKYRGDWEDAPSFSRSSSDQPSKLTQARIVLQDYFLPVLEMQKALSLDGGVINELNDVYRAEERMYGRIEETLRDFRQKWFDPLIAKAQANDITMDELSLYAYAKHAKERNRMIQGIRKDMPDNGSGMTNDEVDDILTMFEVNGQTDLMEDLHGDLMAIAATTRRVMLEEGLITQAEYDRLESQFEFYVPLRGFEDVSLEGERKVRQGGKGFNIKGKETVRALGRRTRAGDIIENMVLDYEKAVYRGERNQVGLTFLQLVKDNPDPDLWEIDARKTKVSFDKAAGRVAKNTVIETGEDTVAIKVNGKEVYVKIHDRAFLRAMRKASKDETGAVERALTSTVGHLTTVMRATLTQYNPAFAMVNAVRDVQMGAVSVLDELGAEGVALYLKHYRAALAASARHQTGALGKTAGWYGDKVMDRYFEEFRAAGGTTGGYYGKSVEDVHGEIRNVLLSAGAAPKTALEKVKTLGGGKAGRSAMRAVQSLGDVLEFAGGASENAARVAAYRAAREMGKSPAEAASIAKNLTTNFNRKGEWGQAINSAFLFFNAAVQGTHRTAKALKNGKVQGLAVGMTMLGVLTAVMAQAMGGDDEDDGQSFWDKIPAHEKERNLIIMLPPKFEMEGVEKVGQNGRYIKIPLPYGFNVFPAIGVNLADAVRNMQDRSQGATPGQAAVNIVNAIMGSFNPLGGAIDPENPASIGMAVAPTVADLAIQQLAGVDSFARPTAPYKTEFDLDPDSENVNARQAGGVFHMLARGLNKVTGGDEASPGYIDVAPGTLENAVKNLTGGTGTFLTDVFLNLPTKALEPEAEITPRDAPVVRNFYGMVDGVNDAALLYQRRRDVLKARTAEKNREELGLEPTSDSMELALAALAQDANAFTKVMSDIRKQEIEVALDTEMSPQMKVVNRRELKTQKDRVAQEFNSVYMEIMRAEAAGDFDIEK